MRVNIQLSIPARTGAFAQVRLSHLDRNNDIKEVDLIIDFYALSDFSGETSSKAFDLFMISCFVYGIDNLLNRHEYSIDGWARDIEVAFPVKNVADWMQVREKVEELLTFLSGDYWTVLFTQTPITSYFEKPAKRWKNYIRTYNYSAYSFASLFSGGLDSLIGVINELEATNSTNKGLFISHFDSTSPGANADQQRLTKILSSQPGLSKKFDWVQSRIYLSTRDIHGTEINREPSLRSRSLLFIGIATYLIEQLPECNTLIIQENGTISLNYPLTPSRSSSLSTRTTHPFFLQSLQDILIAIGLPTVLENPYWNQTKGEMVASCLNQDILATTFDKSVSCGKRGRKMNWDMKTGTEHCGVCMPCIYRRAALHAKALDTQLYGIDLLSTQRDPLTIEDMPALFNFLNLRLTGEDIKRTLLVSGSLDLAHLSEYATVVQKVRNEIKEWILDKGNSRLKALAGIL